MSTKDIDALGDFLANSLEVMTPGEAVVHMRVEWDFTSEAAHKLIRLWWELHPMTREKLSMNIKLMRGWIYQATGRR